MGKKRPEQVKRVHEALKANNAKISPARYRGKPFARFDKDLQRWEISDAWRADASMYFYPIGERWTYQAPYYDEKESTFSRSLGNANCWYTG